MKKSVYLLWLSIKGVLHRLRYDLGREIVVGSSALILLSLFFYIFGDFINVKALELPFSLRSRLSQGWGGLILILITVQLLRLQLSEKATHRSFYNTALRLGETPPTLTYYRMIWWGLQALVSNTLAWWVLLRFFKVVPSSQLMSLQALLIAIYITALNIPWKSRINSATSENTTTWQAPNDTAKVKILFSWRWYQMLYRNRLTRFNLGLALLFLMLMGWITMRNAPFFLIHLVVLIAGLFAAIMLAFQMEDDIRYAWAERSMGISDAEYHGAYERLGRTLGLIIGILGAGIYGLMMVMTSQSFAPTTLIQIMAGGALAPVLMPSLLFQIDPRRPVIQVMTCGLLTLFMGTAILAHWLGVLVPPLFIYYANNYQKGQFYRAS